MTSDELKNHIVGALIVALSVEGKRGAQSVATAIDELIQYRINEAQNAQPEPRFAVGTRVRVSERHHIRAGHTGTVIELRPEIGAVDVRLDINEIELLFPVGRVEPLTSVLEPLPAEPAALPEGVTLAEGTRVRISQEAGLYRSQLGTVREQSSKYGDTVWVHIDGEDDSKTHPFPQKYVQFVASEKVTRERQITLMQEGNEEHTTVSSEITKDNRKVFLSVANGVDYMNMKLTPGQARLLGKKLTAYADWIDANEQREADEYEEDFNDD